MPENITVFLTEGFSPSFYRHLERFSRKLYKKYEVNESWDSFYDDVRTKVEEVLSGGAYDPKKGNFTSFVHSMIRNEGTKATSKNRRKVYIDDPAHQVLATNLVRSELPEVSLVRSFREDFSARACALCPSFDPDVFVSDLVNERLTPIVFAYVWLVYTGGRSELGV